MRKYFLLAGSNLRKTKGQTISIIALVLLGSAMLNLWLILATDYKQNFDRCHDRLHAEHVTLAMDGDLDRMRAFWSDRLAEQEDVAEFCVDDAMCMVGSFDYNGGGMNTECVFLEKQAALSRPIGRIEIVEDSGCESGVYLPMLYRTGDIAVGNTIQIAIGSNQLEYTVCGFFNSAMMGSHNCSMCVIVFTEDQYEELKELGYAPEAALVSVRLGDKQKSEEIEAALKNEAQARFPESRILSNSYLLVSVSRYISQMICAGIVSAVAFCILLIALVVIASNIMNDIQENMRKLGVLKAVGYTGGQLIRSLFMQFLGICQMAAVAGIALSYLVFPFVNRMMMAQTGIPYQIRFLPVPCLLVLAVIGITVTLAVWFSARRIKGIEPIVALRQGVETHNFRRNFIPLEHTKLSLLPALALKTTLSGTRQNVAVCLTMLVVSLVVVFSGLMTENMIKDMTPFIDMVVGETADSCMDIQPGIEEAFLSEMETEDRVEKIYLYTSLEVQHEGGVCLMATLTEDFSRVNNQNVCVEGRFPKYDNEVAIAAKYARECGLKIGDEIRLTEGGAGADYLICGYTQISNNLGKDCLLTRQGYERIGQIKHMSYYLNLAEGVDTEAFHEEIGRRYEGNVNATINIQSMLDGTTAVYVSLMTIIVVAVLVLSIVVIAFVLYLLVRMMLNRKKNDYGIMKALGFTTGQLVLQTALSFMPVILPATFVGLVLSSLVINPLTAIFLSGIGIVKCTFTVPVGFIAVTGICLAAAAFGIACLMSLRIRKISPKNLLTED